MNNFNCDFGVLFFPSVPEFWEEWNTKQRRKALLPHYAKYPEKSQVQIESMNFSEVSKTWDELSLETQNLFEINSVRLIPNPQKSEMRFLLMRLEPNTTEIAIKMRKQTIEMLFEEIIQRILLTAK